MSQPGIELFTKEYAREALAAQASKHDPRVLFFKKQLGAVWDAMAAEGYVLGQATDDATRARMAGLTKNAFIAFRS